MKMAIGVAGFLFQSQPWQQQRHEKHPSIPRIPFFSSLSAGIDINVRTAPSMGARMCAVRAMTQMKCNALVFRLPKVYDITEMLNLFAQFTAGCIVNGSMTGGWMCRCMQINLRGYTIFQITG